MNHGTINRSKVMAVSQTPHDLVGGANYFGKGATMIEVFFWTLLIWWAIICVVVCLNDREGKEHDGPRNIFYRD